MDGTRANNGVADRHPKRPNIISGDNNGYVNVTFNPISQLVNGKQRDNKNSAESLGDISLYERPISLEVRDQSKEDDYERLKGSKRHLSTDRGLFSRRSHFIIALITVFLASVIISIVACFIILHLTKGKYTV